MGLNRYAWWQKHIEQIIAGLRGRYEVIKLGGDPGPPEQLFKSIWNKDPRPMWATHKVNSESKHKMLRIVATVERRARREINNASDHHSQEGQ